MIRFLTDCLGKTNRVRLCLRLVAQFACYVVYFLQPFALRALLSDTNKGLQESMGFIALLAVSMLMPPMVDLLNNWVLQETRRVSKEVLLDCVNNKPYAYNLRHSIGEITSYISEISLACRRVEDSLSHHIIRLVVMSCIYVGYLFTLAGWMGAVYLSFLVIYFVASARLSVGNREMVNSALASTAESSEAIVDFIDNVEAVKTTYRGDEELARLHSIFLRETSEYSAIQRRNNAIGLLQQLLVVSAVVLMLSALVSVSGGDAMNGALLVLLYSTINLTGFGAQYLSIKEMLSRLEAGLDAMEYGTVERLRDERTFDVDASGILISKLVFSYGQEEVIDGVTLKFEKGKLVALVGPNGSGKSTLLKICAGLLEFCQGSVTLPCNGCAGVMYIGQDSELFNRSILDNMTYPSSDDVQLMAELIAELGLDRVIGGKKDLRQLTPGDLSDQLSGGERQKILIIRALLAKPEVLLCDEITSGLDVASADKFYGLVRKHLPDTTCVCVVHRVNELKNFDRIVNIAS